MEKFGFNIPHTGKITLRSQLVVLLVGLLFVSWQPLIVQQHSISVQSTGSIFGHSSITSHQDLASFDVQATSSVRLNTLGWNMTVVDSQQLLWAYTSCTRIHTARHSSLQPEQPAAEMYTNNFSLLCYRLLKPRRGRISRVLFLITILLKMSGLETNPGPDLQFASLNARSVCNKSAIIQDLISDHGLHVLAITESWIDVDDPEAIKLAAVPPGFSVLHEPRLTGLGGGLSVIYRNNLRAKKSDLANFKPRSFRLSYK